MIREESNLSFTNEEKANFVVRRYFDSEVKSKLEDYKEKRKSRTMMFVAIISFLIATSITTNIDLLQYAANLGLIFMIFLIFLFIGIDKITLKASARKFFIELFIDEKLPIETWDDGAISHSSISVFYPVRGTDTTSGFSSVYYVDKKDYKDTELGDKVRITVNREVL